MPDITFVDWLILISLLTAGGAITGVMAGLFGIGGGAILVPILYETFSLMAVPDHVRIHLCLGTSLAIIAPTSLRSLRAHAATGAVDWHIIKTFAPWILIGVVLGAALTKLAPATALKMIWAGSATLMATKLFIGDRVQFGTEIPGQPFTALYGLFVGTISILMSIGGGAYITAMMRSFGRSMHQAVATSSGFGPIVAIPGVIGLIWAGWDAKDLPVLSLGYVSLLGAVIVAPISVLMAPLGVKLAHGLSRRRLEIWFGCFLSWVALRFLISINEYWW